MIEWFLGMELLISLWITLWDAGWTPLGLMLALLSLCSSAERRVMNFFWRIPLSSAHHGWIPGSCSLVCFSIWNCLKNYVRGHLPHVIFKASYKKVLTKHLHQWTCSMSKEILKIKLHLKSQFRCRKLQNLTDWPRQQVQRKDYLSLDYIYVQG